MNLDQLKTFQEVVRLGSFSEVARKLAISQPAVSFQIQKLEHELGMRLIDRSQRAITLTAAGRRLLNFSQAVGKERERLQHELEQMREEVAGDLIIAASPIPGEFLLPPLLMKFRQAHPSVRATAVISDPLTVIRGVRESLYEIGCCGNAPEGRDLDSCYVGGDELVLIVFPEHPFARRGEITPAELEGEPLIFREATSGTQSSVEARLARAGLDVSRLVPNLVLGTSHAVVNAVEAGAGISFVSSLAVRRSLALGTVRQVSVSGLRMERHFYGIYRRERVGSRLVGEFINFMQTEAPRRKND
jgi:DNA-binding transcriptional LysR family regulator